MLRRTCVDHFRSGRSRPYLLRDQTLSVAKQGRTGEVLKTLGFSQVGSGGDGTRRTKLVRSNNRQMLQQWDHAFPLLSNTNFGADDQAGDTSYAQLLSYMPRKHKGTAPWFRGRETYSPLYAEQGRYEYMRYQMVARMPSEYKDRFMKCINDLREAIDAEVPLKVMYTLYNLLVEHHNPQHIHYQIAIEGLTKLGEFSRARDVWKLMERQMTWPDDKLIAAYLNLCAKAGEKEWAYECWNRYCTEKRFLEEGEADPKPVSRTPFTLNRDEMLHLPKWKKFFDHDPNHDVADRNRFNTTRQLYLDMARAMLRCGEFDTFTKYWSDLEDALVTTPSPVPEPPDTVTVERPQWEPSWDQDYITTPNPFTTDAETAKQTRGKTHVAERSMAPRFFMNSQFLVFAAEAVLEDVLESLPQGMDAKTAAAFADELVERVATRLGNDLGELDTSVLVARIIRVSSKLRGASGDDCVTIARQWQTRKAAAAQALAGDAEPSKENHGELVYLELLRAFNTRAIKNAEARELDPRATVASAMQVVREMATVTSLEWTADHHFEIVALLTRCGTMAANKYFVKNVLRKFTWDSRFCYQLYQEYRRHEDVELWAELTKRMLVWTARYNVELDEVTKRAIEDDYATIKVQVRTFREVVGFAFRNTEEKRMAKDPSTLMPNPVNDFVSHALPFPDRDTGSLSEYGDIGQMHDPSTGVKAGHFYMGELPEEKQREFGTELRDTKHPNKPIPLPAPWDAKYKEYARGKHPSYDQIYAGPMPEVFPARMNFRRATRWDFKAVENQSKFKASNPY